MPPSPSQSPPSGQSLSSAHWGVLALVCSLSMITYLDRVCFGVAAPFLAAELDLASVAEMKWAFTSFAIAYALFELPTGWLGDRLGPRAMLIRIVLWWSVCTALTGLVGMKSGGWTFGGLGTLVALRFFFGMGEAGAYPNIARALYNWFPPHRWEYAQGMVWMSGRLMGGITPLIWAVLVTGTRWTAPVVTWRGAFVLFGLVGVSWCLLFWIFFRNHPPGLIAASPEETEPRAVPASHGAIPWKWMLTNRSLLALCGAYSLLNYGWAFNITYLPSYLQQRFGDVGTPSLIALYTGAPLWVGAVGCLCGGACVSLLDRILQDRRRSRCGLGTLAMLGCAASWGIASLTESLHVFSISVAMAAFFVDLTLGAAWATCQDLGREQTAVATAFMNTIGTLGAALATWLTGTLVQLSLSQSAASEGLTVPELTEAVRQAASRQGFQTVFLTYIVFYLVAALCWFMVQERRSTPQADNLPAA